MKIQYFSDLHLEFVKSFPIIKCVAAILCLNGDMGYPFDEIYKQFLIHINSLGFEKIFLLAENHEYYNETKSIDEINEKIKEIIVTYKLSKISFLNNSYEIHNNICFIGSTLWSSIPGHKSRKLTNDFKFIQNLSIELYNDMHFESVKFIEKIATDQ